MIARNVSRQDLDKALQTVNEKYDGNVIWKREPTPTGKGFRFTLRVLQARGKGGRLGIMGLMGYGKPRHIPAACWHVHGDFFDVLFAVNPNAYVWSGKNRISKDAGNWQDRNVGSQMNYVSYSDACECAELFAGVN
jgi:hypothetical protein